MRRRITIPVVRAVVMLGLGSGGMARELFLTDEPSVTRMTACIGLMLGPAVLESWWRARNPPPTQPDPAPPASSSSSASS